MLTLYGGDGCGSAVVEAVCTLVGEPYEFIPAEPWEDRPGTARLRQVNPLAQIPTLVLPDGTVMTESVAMLLWLLERHPGSGLAPEPGDPLRALFLRWLVFLPAAIYPMYTVGDFPERWVPGAGAQDTLRQATIQRILACWRGMEQALRPQRWVLGDGMSVLDLYVAMMTRWRPRREAIRAVAPGLVAAGERAEADPRLADLWRRNFPTADLPAEM